MMNRIKCVTGESLFSLLWTFQTYSNSMQCNALVLPHVATSRGNRESNEHYAYEQKVIG